jgi:hypothetical protein
LELWANCGQGGFREKVKPREAFATKPSLDFQMLRVMGLESKKWALIISQIRKSLCFQS